MTSAPEWSDGRLDGSDLARIARLGEAHARIRKELAKRIIGMGEVIDRLLIAFFAGGHALLVGVPGLAKTLLVRTLADAMDLSFKRIQFTPDLMPSDITGTEIIGAAAEGDRGLCFAHGPVFTHILLADEINRTPPKTQAALMEAMEEGQVTCGGRKHPIDRPFFVLATQNPIEQEGTYPLPVAQLDRFMFHIPVGYPTADEEFEIARLTTAGWDETPSRILSRAEVEELIALVRRLPVPRAVAEHALALARRSRPDEPDAPPFVKEWVEWGAGPRAAQFLILGAKAAAILDGRPFPVAADVDRIVLPVLRHRILPNFQAEAGGIGTDVIVARLLDAVNGGTGKPKGLASRILARVMGKGAGKTQEPISRS